MQRLQKTCLLACLSLMYISIATGQDKTHIDFARDVHPILVAKCLECHGEEDAKNDYRVDEEENFLSYVEAGDLESSSLWADYLISDDEDMHMPPLDKPQLTGIELATIKMWIEEGAIWKIAEIEELAEEELEQATEVDVTQWSTAYRMWLFQGYFHPASTHFPIALLTVSTISLLLSFVRRDSFEPVAFHCLWMGAAGAVLACLMGWAYAQDEGYASGLSFQNTSINRHRWLGIGVALFALIVIPIARSVRKDRGFKNKVIWLLCSIGLMLGVSITGYQGGELTYGEDHYAEEYQRLFPDSTPQVGENTTETEDESASSEESAAEPTDADESTDSASEAGNSEDASSEESAAAEEEANPESSKGAEQDKESEEDTDQEV